MRTEEDIVRVSMRLSGVIELDLERIETDPNWRSLSNLFNLPDELPAALEAYIMRYVGNELFLRDMPCTNGPGNLGLMNMEVAFGQRTSGNRNPGDSDAGIPGQDEQ